MNFSACYLRKFFVATKSITSPTFPSLIGETLNILHLLISALKQTQFDKLYLIVKFKMRKISRIFLPICRYRHNTFLTLGNPRPPPQHMHTSGGPISIISINNKNPYFPLLCIGVFIIHYGR